MSNSKMIIGTFFAFMGTLVYEIFHPLGMPTSQSSGSCEATSLAVGAYMSSMLLTAPSMYDLAMVTAWDDATVELVGTDLSSTCIFILFLFGFGIQNEHMQGGILISCLFWGSIFPFIMMKLGDYKARKFITINKVKYESDKLLITSKRLFCSECVLFLIDYQLYLLNTDRFATIKRKYFRADSEYELNIDEELRKLVILPDGNLDKVYLEMIDLVSSNVVTQLS